MKLGSLFLSAIGSGAVCIVQATDAARCSPTSSWLTAALPSNAHVISAAFVAAGGSYGEGSANLAYPTNPTNLPPTCAVIVNVTTSSSSSFRFGLFLPTTTWNRRYLTVGNGGFAGGINWLDMGAGLRYGFAVASTDLGHNSSALDITWALNQEQKRLDFGFRATHGTTAIAKKLVRSFYASDIAYSYYSGCSTGGRQGLKDVQLYPDDFDGILVGAPAWWTAHLQTWTTRIGVKNLPAGSPNHVPPPLFARLASEAVSQCDGADGVLDGIISAPDLCDFKPEALLCTAADADADSCFTAAQLETVRAIYADYRIGGKLAFPGLEIGSEDLWFILLSGTEPASLGLQYIQYMLLNDPTWPWQNYTDSLVALADQKDPGDCTADDYAAMARFRDSGGKVLMYHGLADALIPTGSSTYFYQATADALGGIQKLNSWFRFFLVPGLQHCAGTSVDAPWYIAGPNQAGSVGTDVFSVPGFDDPKHDALMALMEWTEKGRPVDRIVATTWADSSNITSGVTRQRPICPYPSRPKYDGAGDVDLEESWGCSGLTY